MRSEECEYLQGIILADHCTAGVPKPNTALKRYTHIAACVSEVFSSAVCGTTVCSSTVSSAWWSEFSHSAVDQLFARRRPRNSSVP